MRLSRAATLSASYELAHTARRVVAQASFSCRCATIHLLAPYGMDRVTTLFPLLKGDVWRVGGPYEITRQFAFATPTGMDKTAITPIWQPLRNKSYHRTIPSARLQSGQLPPPAGRPQKKGSLLWQ